MRYAVLLLVIAAGLTLGGTYLSQNEGYIELGLSTGAYKMPIWYFLTALVLGIIALMVLFKILWTIIRLPAITKRFGKNRRALKANDLLQKGMLAMGKGQWGKAEKALAKGARLSYKANKDPSLFLTTAAQAAYNQGSEIRRDQYLLEARQLSVEGVDTFASTLAEGRLHLDAGEAQLALTAISPQKAMHSNNPQLMALESAAHEELGNYLEVWDLLLRMRTQFPDKAGYKTRQLEVAKQLFADSNSTLDSIEKVWSELPKASKKDEGVFLNYISGLLHHGQEEKAEKLLAKEIKATYADPVIHAYTQLDVGSSTERLAKVRKWLKFNPDNAYLNYGAAKWAFQSEQLENAKVYAEKSIKELAMPETFALLGKIYEAQGQVSQALAAYKGSVRLIYADDTPVSGEVLPIDEGVKKLEKSTEATIATEVIDVEAMVVDADKKDKVTL